MTSPARVFLVGAGPWDPELLTLRARAALRAAEVVIADADVHPDVLAHAPANAQCHAGGPDDAARLIDAARAGRAAVRLFSGDPWRAAAGVALARALADAGVPFEVVPGVPAELAAATCVGIPLDAARARFGDTEVHTVATAAALRDLATKRLADTPVTLVRWTGASDPQVVDTTVAACAYTALEPPLTAIVGERARQRGALDWYVRRPLHGRRVVVTRSGAQQGVLVDALRALGAVVIPLPTIDFEPPADPAPVDAALAALSTYDWVVFTSANGVDAFLEAIYARDRDVRVFRDARVACIGPATARRLADRGIRPDLVPESYIAEGLIDALRALGIAGRRFLVPRAEVAREILPDTLRAEGAHVDVLGVYRTVAAPVDEGVRARVAAGEVDVVTFTASSTVSHFCGLFAEDEMAVIRQRVRAACIGPVTADTARAHGLQVAVTAETYTIPGLVLALADATRGE